MSITTSIFSALGNNSSLYPIIFKDGVDIAGRTAMAYTEGSKTNQKYGVYGARESFLEETATSIVWLAGIPALKLLYDKTITNNVYKFKNMPELGSTFDKKGSRVLADTNLKLFGNGLQTLQGNIDAIIKSDAYETSKVLQDLVKEAQKILDTKDNFKRLYAGKMAFATLIPLSLIGFVLPKLIQKMTKAIYKNDQEISEKSFSNYNIVKNNPKIFAAFSGSQNDKDKNVSFKGQFSNFVIDFFNNDVANQVVLDAGITTGRIVTGVNFADKVEKAIKEAGIIFFIYLGGTIVGGLIEKIAKKLGMPIDLDSTILEDTAFKNEVKQLAGDGKKLSNFIEFPECQDSSLRSLFKAESINPEFQKLSLFEKIKTVRAKSAKINEENERQILKFIDEQIKNGVELVTKEKAGQITESYVFKNATLREAQKLKLIELIEGVKDPLKYIDADKLKNLNSSIKEYAEKALTKGTAENIETFLKKSVFAKRGGIILNLAICSAFTGYIIPKVQYIFREKYTKTTHLPSLETYDKEIKAEKLALQMA